MKNMKYKIGDKVECVDDSTDEYSIEGRTTFGRLMLRNIKKGGSLGKVKIGFEYKKVKGLRGEVLDIMGENLIVGFVPSLNYPRYEPHPYHKGYKVETNYPKGSEQYHHWYWDKGIECSPSKVVLVNDDLEIRKLEEEINNKEKEIEELKQQIETIKKEVK